MNDLETNAIERAAPGRQQSYQEVAGRFWPESRECLEATPNAAAV
jgi:hypothetical protein